MSFLKQRQHKRFNYKPRFDKSQEQDSNRHLKEAWETIKSSGTHSKKRIIGLPLLVILLVLIIIIMYYLDTILV